MTPTTGSASSPSWTPNMRYSASRWKWGCITSPVFLCDCPSPQTQFPMSMPCPRFRISQWSTELKLSMMLSTSQGEAIFFLKHCGQIPNKSWVIVRAIFRAKIVNTTLALRTTQFLINEVEYMPWQTASRNLDYFFLMFDRSELYGPMQVCDERSFVIVRSWRIADWFMQIQYNSLVHQIRMTCFSFQAEMQANRTCPCSSPRLT